MVLLSWIKEYLSSLSLVSRWLVSVFMLNASTLKFARSPEDSSSVSQAAVFRVAMVSMFSCWWVAVFLAMMICPASFVFSFSVIVLRWFIGYCIVLVLLW